MDIEDMKHAWKELNKRVEDQEILTNQLIMKMTQKRYNSKLNKIGTSEYVGTLVCYMGATYLILNFTKIDGTSMRVLALIAIALLFILPIISLKSLRAVKSVNISSKTYLEAIDDFGKRKIRFQKLQKLNVSLGLFLLLIAVPILLAIQGKDLSQAPNYWTLFFPISIAFFLVFAFWVLRSYNKILNETEKMLSEINN